jgi:hypothetical protein
MGNWDILILTKVIKYSNEEKIEVPELRGGLYTPLQVLGSLCIDIFLQIFPGVK